MENHSHPISRVLAIVLFSALLLKITPPAYSATTNLQADFMADSLTILAGDVFNTQGFEVTISSFISNAGTLNATDEGSGNEGDESIIRVGGNWTNTGVFIAGGSTVIFSSGTHGQQVHNRGQAFNVLVASNTHSNGLTFVSSFTAALLTVNTENLNSAATIYFAGQSTFTISTFTIIGTSAYPVVLKSTDSSQYWYLNNTSTHAVSFAQVQRSSASASFSAIQAYNSVDLTNNVNWNFSPAGQTMTWTGTNGTAWNDALNWNPTRVPVSADNIVIPNTSNKPLLNSAITINSMNISQGNGALDLNNYNLTVSTYITLVGTLTARGNEQIAVGGNWTNTGGWFNAANSTVTFNAASTFTVQTNGQAFYNVAFNNASGAWRMLNSLTAQRDLTVINTNSATAVSMQGHAINVGRHFTIFGGWVVPSTTTLSVGGNWDTRGGTFTYNGSRVIMTATSGNVTMRTQPSFNDDYYFSPRFNELHINSGSNKVTWTDGESMMSTTSLTLSGELEVPEGQNSYLSATGRLIVNSGGILSGSGEFNKGITNSATLIVNEGTISISDFNYRTMPPPSAAAPPFISPGHSTFTISTINFTGSADHYVTLKSTDDAVKWYLNGVSSHTAHYVYVSSSDASGSDTIYAYNSIDGGGNVNWVFVQDDIVTTWQGDDGVSPTDWTVAENWMMGSRRGKQSCYSQRRPRVPRAHGGGNFIHPHH
jgi:hypothetical protein